MKPEYKVIANRQDITAIIGERFVALSITDESGTESDAIDIVLADHDRTRPVELPPTGAELEVYIGYDGSLQRMGLYVVDEVELAGWPGTLTIRGKASPFTGSKDGKTDLLTQKSRSWPKNTTIGALVAKIAKEHKLTPAVAASLSGKVLPHTDQTDESDISFLTRIAKRHDAICKPADGKILFAKRGQMQTVGGEDLPEIAISAMECSRYCMTLAKREEAGTVVSYWHAKRTAKKNEVSVGSGEPVRRLRHWYQDEEAAKEAAQAELDKRIRGEHKLTLTMPGDPLLCAESPLVASGFRPGIDGKWLATRVSHTLSKATGYVCDIEAEKEKAEAETEEEQGA